MASAPDPDHDDQTASPSVDAAEAWKAVSLVNDWVRHAETKAAATLAASGVIGGVLYNLVKSGTNFDCWIKIGATACGAFVVASALFAVVALWPRLAASDSPTSVLYFDHIARRHPSTRRKRGTADAYIAELKQVVLSPDLLLGELGQQVWANAQVARHKYTWTGRALIALFGAALALAVVAIDFGVQSVWGPNG